MSLWFNLLRAFYFGLVIITTTAHAETQDATSQGHADRVQLERWFEGLSREYKAGALFWSTERSKSSPMSCFASASAANDDFLAGCQEAQKRLALPDVRRKTEPLYRAGWNAPVTNGAGPTANNSAPPDDASKSSGQSPSRSTAETQLLDCNSRPPILLDQVESAWMRQEDVAEMYFSLQAYLDRMSRLSIRPHRSSAEGFLATWIALKKAADDAGVSSSSFETLIARVDDVVRAGGAKGMASNVATFRAFSAHGVKDPYEMQYRQEEGAFNELPDGTFLIAAQVNEVVREMGGLADNAINSGGASHLGISMSQFRLLRNALGSEFYLTFKRKHSLTEAWLTQCYPAASRPK